MKKILLALAACSFLAACGCGRDDELDDRERSEKYSEQRRATERQTIGSSTPAASRVMGGGAASMGGSAGGGGGGCAGH